VPDDPSKYVASDIERGYILVQYPTATLSQDLTKETLRRPKDKMRNHKVLTGTLQIINNQDLLQGPLQGIPKSNIYET